MAEQPQSDQLLHSPLHERHVAAGAKFAEFGGWEMPLEYAGVLAEHTAVREGVGIFDVSHLGKMRITGPGAVAYANTVFTNDLAKIGPGQAQYTLLCNAEGGVIDDLIAYEFSAEELFCIPNAANTTTVCGVLADSAPAGITVTNEHRDFAVIAVQGPKSDETLAALGLPVGHDYMRFAQATLNGIDLTVCRTGYTGERGYELVCAWADAVAVWDAVIEAGQAYGIAPAGLAARDTLRTEMGYPLHGQDLSPTISPVEARTGWAVGWKKETFHGAEALRAQKAAGPSRILRGLKATGRGIPRPHMVVRNAAGEQVGEVTTGTFSPTLKVGIALALLDSAITEGDSVTVDVRKRSEAFEVVKPPFVTPGVRAD
ncbi:glycine cleavage system aminomethyltransferase GcvT [Granulicoccus phenolivorans]|uniref:glycine cleavage system aminomethyltransferase GcvT n=1 Tax=Granulicoccus phenolivorans TaxID=266854 RepID=UPI0003F7E47D|nr:glycine cleavage system aminomethyltransferase GcvT [Granulicoccus phenolivorans]